MYFRRRYKNLYLPRHPRQTWVFSKLQRLPYYFPENFRCNLTYYKGENFSDSSQPLHHIFEFFTTNWNLSDKLRKLYMNGWSVRYLSRPQIIENSRQYFLLRTDIHNTESSRWFRLFKQGCRLKHWKVIEALIAPSMLPNLHWDHLPIERVDFNIVINIERFILSTWRFFTVSRF